MKTSPFSPRLCAWALFDWANSAFPTIVTTFIFATYFTESIVGDPIEGTHAWGNAQALAGLCIALLSPLLGSLANETGHRKRWLFIFTGILVISSSCLWFATPSQDSITWTLTCVVLGTIGLEIGMIFYNAMLKDISPRSHIGRYSGWGWGVGYAGGLACLLIALMVIPSDLNWHFLTNTSSQPIRASGPLVGLWVLIFSLPLFLVIPERKSSTKGLVILKQTPKLLKKTLSHIRKSPNIAWYLLARMIYLDGLNTLFAFGGIYAAGTFQFSLTDILLLGLSLNITAGIGAFSFGWLDDAIGSKKVLFITLSCLLSFGIASLVVTQARDFWICALFLGLFIGPIQSSSRSLLARLIPPSQSTEWFGLYALSGKITAFLGPWLVAYVTEKTTSQRFGMSAIMVLLLIGMLLLIRVKEVKT